MGDQLRKKTRPLLVLCNVFAIVALIGLFSLPDYASSSSINQSPVKVNTLPTAGGQIMLTLVNTTEESLLYYLELSDRWIKSAALIPVEDGIPIVDRTFLTGTSIPIEDRALRSHLPAFIVTLLPHSSTTYSLSFSHFENRALPEVSLWDDPTQFWSKSNREQNYLSILWGVLWAILIFASIALYATRTRDIAYYIGFISSAAYCFGIAFNVNAQLLFLSHLDGSLVGKMQIPVFCIGSASLLLFTLKFLDTRKLNPAADRWARNGGLLLSVLFATIVATGAIPETHYFSHQPIILLICSFFYLCLPLALYSLNKGHRAAAYLLLASSIIVVVSAQPLWAVITEKNQPSGIDLIRLVVGFSLGMIVLSIALAERFLLLREEKALAKAVALKEEKKKHALQEQYQEELTAKIRSRSEELKSIYLQKNRLLAIVSHDLRVPVSDLSAVAIMMRQAPETFTESNISLYTKEIKGKTKRLLSLLENLLQWAHIQTKEIILDSRQQPLRAMILPTYELYKESAEQANVALEIDIEENITVDADPKHINTVLRNLLSNALKITSGGDSITITAVASDETVRLSVRDTGCGMPKEQVEVLTSQLKNTGTSTLPTTSPNNAGFGLNICKHLLSLHYSELTVVSEQNIGTTLSFELNIAPAPTKI